MGLGCVFQYIQIVLTRDREDRIQIGRLSIEMDGKNRPASRRYCRFDKVRIDVVGRRIGLHRYRTCPHCRHCEPCSNVGIRRDNYFVAQPDVECPQGERQSIKTVCDPHRMSGTTVVRPLCLKGLYFRTENILTTAEDATDRRIDLFLDLEIAGAKV